MTQWLFVFQSQFQNCYSLIQYQDICSPLIPQNFIQTFCHISYSDGYCTDWMSYLLVIGRRCTEHQWMILWPTLGGIIFFKLQKEDHDTTCAFPGSDVDEVEEYKYQGIYINNRLNQKTNPSYAQNGAEQALSLQEAEILICVKHFRAPSCGDIEFISSFEYFGQFAKLLNHSLKLESELGRQELGRQPSVGNSYTKTIVQLLLC